MNRRGQIAAFLILLSAVLILAIIATMLIGEAAFQRLRLANLTDAGLISATSGLCRGLNQIRMINTRMLLNTIQLQSALWSRGIWPSKNAGYAAALGWTLIGIETNRELLKQAEKLAEDLPKNLRVNLFDAVFGGALIDEPKPFIDLTGNNANDESSEDEVDRDDSGRIISLNYRKYLKRKSHFEEEYLKFKKGECAEGVDDCLFKQVAGKEKWYKHNMLSYSYNKKKKDFLERKGVLNPGPPLSQGYNSFLQVELNEVTDSISIAPQWFVLTFLYEKGKYIAIGLIPHPYAWIRRVDIDSYNFGLTTEKKTTYGVLSSQPVLLEHQASVRIKGDVYRGFDFVLEE